MRKASTRFYPQLHLELARYVAHARACGFDLGAPVLRHIDALTGKTPPPWARPTPAPAPTQQSRHARSRTEASVPSLPELQLGKAGL